MPEFYTLDNAARALGMSPEELKSKAQSREVRAFMDSGTWQFRKADIDELARRRGMGSDPDLSLSDLDLEIPGSDSDPEMLLSEFQLGVTSPDLAPPSIELITEPTPTDQDILLDDISLPPDPMTNSSSTIIGMKPSGKMPSDSDVRLIPDNTASTKGASDSDVRLRGVSDSDIRLTQTGSLGASASDVRLVPDLPEGAKGKAKSGSGSDVQLAPDSKPIPPKRPILKPSDSDVGLAGAGFEFSTPPTAKKDSGSGSHSSDTSGETTIARSPFADPGGGMISGSGSGSIADDDSDFELTPSSVIDALQPESGSDFELTAMDASDEYETEPRPKPGDSDVTGIEPSASGINLARPSDSGINLQAMGGFDMGGDSVELAPLDDDDDAPMGRPAPAPPKPKPKKADLAATSLPVRDTGEKDIFEDTDFEVDALDAHDLSDDRTVQLEAASDFDLDDSDSASEVFAIDEDDVDQNAATAMAPAVLDEDDEDEDDDGFSAVEAEVSESASAWDVDEDAGVSQSARPLASPMLAGRGEQTEWGGLWVGMLGVTTVIMFLLAFVGMDLIRNLYEFQGDGPASGLITSIAGLLKDLGIG
ncbi:MAG: helix-turn-helix domain-containing protein [Isosphaeraceae bacterium]